MALVNVYITMVQITMLSMFFFFLMVIFNSYVKLPEGNPYAAGMVYLPDTLGDFVALVGKYPIHGAYGQC